MPLIWTKTEVVPNELVTVQAGPGGFQPDGVGPGVNQRFASPPVTLVVIPGLKGLALNEASWVWFRVMSVIRTTNGEHPTLGFQEEFVVTAAAAGVNRPGEANRVEIASIANNGAKSWALRFNYSSSLAFL